MKKWFLIVNLSLLLAIFTVAFIYSQWPLFSYNTFVVVTVSLIVSLIIFLLIRKSTVKTFTDYLALALTIGFAYGMVLFSQWAIFESHSHIALIIHLINFFPLAFGGGFGYRSIKPIWPIAVEVLIFLQWFLIGLLFFKIVRKLIFKVQGKKLNKL